MDITDLTLKLMMLFFPGIICAGMVGSLTIRKPIIPFFFVMRAFAFGVASYFTYYAALQLLTKFTKFHISHEIYFVKALISKDFSISIWEIMCVSFIAVIIAIIYSVVYRYKLYYRIMRWCGFTTRPGDSDTWEFAFGLRPKEFSAWVTVRDHKYNLFYDGWIMASSDDSVDTELLLRDVAVYRNTNGKFLYQVGAMYISRDRADLTIEFTGVQINEKNIVQPQDKEEDEEDDRPEPNEAAATTASSIVGRSREEGDKPNADYTATIPIKTARDDKPKYGKKGKQPLNL